MKRSLYILWSIAGFLLLANFLIWSSVLSSAEDVLKVAVLDIGQGDAIFIESPTGTQLLVDSGPNLAVLRKLGRQMRFFDRSIDAVLATHPDADHIGGFPEVFDRFKVASAFVSGTRSATPVFNAFEERVSEEGLEEIKLLRGDVLDLGGGVFAEVLFPDRDLSSSEPNTSSVVLRLVYGETVFILTGDAPKEVENFLALLDGKELKADVLKVGHHGSRTSTGKAFASAVSPEYAVISAGCDNSFGHPHKEVLGNLKALEAEVLSTCENGSTVFESDGKQVFFK